MDEPELLSTAKEVTIGVAKPDVAISVVLEELLDGRLVAEDEKIEDDERIGDGDTVLDSMVDERGVEDGNRDDELWETDDEPVVI